MGSRVPSWLRACFGSAHDSQVLHGYPSYIPLSTSLICEVLDVQSTSVSYRLDSSARRGLRGGPHEGLRNLGTCDSFKRQHPDQIDLFGRATFLPRQYKSRTHHRWPKTCFLHLPFLLNFPDPCFEMSAEAVSRPLFNPLIASFNCYPR